MPITAFYAALLAMLYMALTKRVIGARRSAKVALGDGGDAVLARHIRVHANFAEYVPLALILMALAESLKTVGPVLHLMGIGLLVARLVHAHGMSQSDENFKFRIFGMMTTFIVTVVGAGACLIGAVLAFAG